MEKGGDGHEAGSCQRPNHRCVDTRQGLWIVFKMKWKLLQNLEVCLGHLETALSPGGIPATRGTWTLGFMAQLLGLRDACLSLGLGVLICEMGAGR